MALWSVLVLEGLLLFVGTGALITGLRRQWRTRVTGAVMAPAVLGGVAEQAAQQEPTAVEAGEPVTGASAPAQHSTEHESAGTLISA